MDSEIHAMVVTAHPDDAEFGASGTVAHWTRAGHQVVYVVSTSGDKGSSDPTIRPRELAEIREREQQAAAAALGVKEVVFLRQPDQGLEDTPGFRKQIVRMIRIHRPRIVVTSDPYRRYIWHRDHRIIGQVVLDAVFPYARDHLAYPDLIQEGLTPHKVKEIWFFGTEDANHWMDISETFDRKVAALQCHASQIKELGVTDLATWLRERQRQWAPQSEFEVAEAFHRVVAPG